MSKNHVIWRPSPRGIRTRGTSGSAGFKPTVGSGRGNWTSSSPRDLVSSLKLLVVIDSPPPGAQ